MRFALLEIKLTLVTLLRKFNVEPTKNTEKELSFIEGIGVRTPVNPIKVRLAPRF
jgi:hypothetical protein